MTDPIAALSEALKDRYRLERELGRGGMAIVWLARDLRHDRPVALKVLRPELAAALGAERFQREIRLAARLQHPHILSVFDSGEAEGFLWFTMPYVRGESLRDRLARDGRLSVDEAFRITREAAQALQYAHGEGIIHRDVKPENILLTEDGSTLVADFGIARHVDGGGSTPRLTETGLAIGTPAYMSPEQAMGERSTDARTDQYALATVCWEMLAGALPFSGPTPAAVIASRLTTAAPSVRTARADVTEPQDQAIRRALATRADERFATIGDFARALNAGHTPPAATTAASVPRAPRRRAALLLMLLAGVLLAGAGLFVTRRLRAPAPAVDGDRRLAVLPFTNLGDTANAYFVDGVTDAVRGKLTAVPGLTVIASTSSNDYHATTKSPSDIARELGVRYLLVGKVRWARGESGSRVQVSPELIEITSEGSPTSRWQQPFDATLTDVFEVQGAIAAQVATALGVALGEQGRRALDTRPTTNLEAYDAFLRGQASMQFTIPGLQSAARQLEEAVALDSTFGEAWAQLSRVRTFTYLIVTPTPELAERARVAMEHAIRYAPTHSFTALARAQYLSIVRRDYAQALETANAALRAAPNNAELTLLTGVMERSLGHWDKAVTLLREATALDPRSHRAYEELAHTLARMRRFAEAIDESEHAIALDSANLNAVEWKAIAFLGLGEVDSARATEREAERHASPEDVATHFALYWDLYWLLDSSGQRRVLSFGDERFGGDRGLRTLTQAQVHAFLGHDVLARAYADSASALLEAQLRATPGDGQRQVLLGLALAFAGHGDSAVRVAERSVEVIDVFEKPYIQHQLLRIHLQNGDRERALDLLESLLTAPYWITPAWLRVDPNFTSLRNEPRFRKLVAPR